MKTMKNMERLKNILGIINPTDELIFFRGVGIPPTRDSSGIGARISLENNQYIIMVK